MTETLHRWPRIRIPQKQEVQVDSEKEPEETITSIYTQKKRNGKIQPLQGGYDALQKIHRLKIIRSPRGRGRNYEFKSIDYILTKDEEKYQRKEEAQTLPDRGRLLIEYKEGTRVHIYLEKESLGKIWIEAEIEKRI